MIERTMDIATSSGAMETFIVHPEQYGPFNAVVLYMDVWGIREELRDIARRVATVGYYVLLPDFYHRQGKVRTEFRNAKGDMVSMDLLTDEQRAIALAPLNKLTDAMVIEDTQAVLDFTARNEPVNQGAMGAMGAIGYCMGGRHVFRVMGAFPERFKACASLHGSATVTSGADSPHLDAARAGGELYCGHAERDRHSQPAILKILNETAWKPKYHYSLHKSAHHGYALPDRDVHDKQAANRDWAMIFAMFRRQLPLTA